MPITKYIFNIHKNTFNTTTPVWYNTIILNTVASLWKGRRLRIEGISWDFIMYGGTGSVPGYDPQMYGGQQVQWMLYVEPDNTQGIGFPPTGDNQLQARPEYCIARGQLAVDKAPDSDDRIDYPDYAVVGGAIAGAVTLVAGTGGPVALSLDYLMDTTDSWIMRYSGAPTVFRDKGKTKIRRIIQKDGALIWSANFFNFNASSNTGNVLRGVIQLWIRY